MVSTLLSALVLALASNLFSVSDSDLVSIYVLASDMSLGSRLGLCFDIPVSGPVFGFGLDVWLAGDFV